MYRPAEQLTGRLVDQTGFFEGLVGTYSTCLLRTLVVFDDIEAEATQHIHFFSTLA